MIEIGKEYIFNYRVDDNCGEDDVELCITNDGLNCKVIDDIGVINKYGHMYEVESCTGSEFFAYESELDELKETDISCMEDYFC